MFQSIELQKIEHPNPPAKNIEFSINNTADNLPSLIQFPTIKLSTQSDAAVAKLNEFVHAKKFKSKSSIYSSN
jgi:hypothetical protein